MSFEVKNENEPSHPVMAGYRFGGFTKREEMALAIAAGRICGHVAHHGADPDPAITAGFAVRMADELLSRLESGG